jgi:hypothetical protein
MAIAQFTVQERREANSKRGGRKKYNGMGN